MDAGKCFADVIGDPQALNDFLSNAQLLASQENSHGPPQISQLSNNLDFLASIVATATDEQFPNENNQGTVNSNSKLTNSSMYGNSQISNYPKNQTASFSTVPQVNNPQTTSSFNYMITTSQVQALNSLGSSSVPHNTQVSFNSLPLANQQGNAAQGSPGQIIYGNHSSDGSASAGKISTQKVQGKQATKHMPNILSKGTPSNANSATNQTLLLPANMGGKYIIVNNPGQAPQAVAVGQNMNQGVQQQLTHDLLQNNRQQNQQVLFLPSNFQKAGTQANSVQKQGNIVQNQRVNSPQQQSAIQSIAASPQVAKQSPISQKSVHQNVSGTILPRQSSPLQKGTSLVQPKPQLQGLQSNQPLSRNVSGQSPMTNSVYQMQNIKPVKSSEGVKIVRPAVQPRGILPKPANQSSQMPETKSDAKASMSKLSHYPVVQTQLQNLQNLVSQQDIKQQFVQASQQTHQLPGNQGSINLIPKVQIDPSSSNLSSQAQQRTNVPLGTSFGSMPGNSNVTMKTAGNIALQQLLQLSQAATQSAATNAKDSPAEIAALVQKSILASQQNQNRDKLTTQQKLLQQALAGTSNAQVFLQPAKQQTVAGNDVQSSSNRANIIEKNLQNILSRQNANKQAALQKDQSNNSIQSAASSAVKVDHQQGQNQPLQLFMPKHLTPAQLMELQQKLLAGKIMQKMQEVHPKIVSKPDGAANVSNTVIGQSLTGINAAGNKQTFTLKQIPGTSSSPPSYQFIASGEAGDGNQVVVPISSQGMQVFLKQNSTVSQSVPGGSGKAQSLVMLAGSNQAQKLNLPILQGTSNNRVSKVDGATVQGVRIQNAATSNIVIKQMNASATNTLSEQQKTLQSKKLQQLLLQLTPAQRNILLKKQQELVSKGQSVPLTKLIYQVKQDKISTVKVATAKDVQLGKRSATEEIKQEEANEPKVARRLKHCLAADQTRTLEPTFKAPFTTIEDALSRLLPYHIFHESIPPDIEWQKAEAVFSIVSKQLINRKDKLLDKYHMLMLEESQHEIPSSEMVMLERIFLADEKAKLAKDREDAKLGKFKLFPESAEVPEEVTQEADSQEQREDLGTDRESLVLDMEEDVDIDRERLSSVDDTAEGYENGPVEEEEQDEEEEDNMEELEDEIDDSEQIDNGNTVDEAEEDYEEEEEDVEEDDMEDTEENMNIENGEDEDDEQMESEEDDGLDDDDDDDDEYNEHNLDINNVMNREPNDDFSELVEIEDFDRTNEQNMSEELSEATFNLMADLENDMKGDYYL